MEVSKTTQYELTDYSESTTEEPQDPVDVESLRERVECLEQIVQAQADNVERVTKLVAGDEPASTDTEEYEPPSSDSARAFQ